MKDSNTLLLFLYMAEVTISFLCLHFLTKYLAKKVVIDGTVSAFMLSLWTVFLSLTVELSGCILVRLSKELPAQLGSPAYADFSLFIWTLGNTMMTVSLMLVSFFILKKRFDITVVLNQNKE